MIFVLNSRSNNFKKNIIKFRKILVNSYFRIASYIKTKITKIKNENYIIEKHFSAFNFK